MHVYSRQKILSVICVGGKSISNIYSDNFPWWWNSVEVEMER